MNSSPILVVDDKRDLAQGAALVLRDLSDDVTAVFSAEEALARLKKAPFFDSAFHVGGTVDLAHGVAARLMVPCSRFAKRG